MTKAKQALAELGAVLREWIAGQGNLIGLLRSWGQVVIGQVRPTDKIRLAE